MEATKTQKVAFNTVVQIVGKAITTAISLVLIASITRYLGVSGYGQYTTIFAYVGFWAVLADFGFFWILVREISKPKAQVEKIFNNIITLRAFLGLAIFIIAFLVSLFIPTYPLVVKLGIGVCAAGWFWISLNSTYVGVFQSNLKMQYAVVGDVIGRIIIIGLVLTFIKLNYPLNAIIFAYLIGNLVNFSISMYFGRKFVHFKPSFDFKYWKSIFIETLPMGIILVLEVLYFKVDTVILSLFKSSVDVGIYGAPFKIMEILILVPGMFMGNVFPIITKYIVENDKRLHSALQKSYDFLAIIAAPVVGGVFMLATPIIKFIAGEEFVTTSTLPPFFNHTAASPLVLQILVFAIGIYYMTQLYISTTIAMGKQRELVKPYLFCVLVNIGLNLILIPKFSYIGAAFTTIITAASVMFFASRIVARHEANIRFNYSNIFKAIFSALIMMAVLYFINMNLFVEIIIGAAVYVAVIFLTGGITKETIKTLVAKN